MARSSSPRRKVVIFIAVSGGLGVLLWVTALIVYLLPAGGQAAGGGAVRLRNQYDRIQLGMSRDEVERILGGGGTRIIWGDIPAPTADHKKVVQEVRDYGLSPIFRWREGSGQLIVGFLPNGGQELVAFRGWFSPEDMRSELGVSTFRRGR